MGFFHDPTRDVYLTNVPYHLDEEAIFRLAARHATVLQVRLIVDHGSGLSRGRCYLRFTTPEDQQRALKALDGLAVDGRALKARPVNVPTSLPKGGPE